MVVKYHIQTYNLLETAQKDIHLIFFIKRIKVIINKKSIFAATLQIFQFTNEEIKPLIDEVNSKKNLITKTKSSHNYFTDFRNPIQLYEYEKLINEVANKYSDEGLSLNLLNYWTAVYGNNSIHGAHQHDSMGVNFSTVLYLTNGGATTFLSPHNATNQRVYDEESVIGKLIIFPSTLWHHASYSENQERIIISSNIQIISHKNG